MKGKAVTIFPPGQVGGTPAEVSSKYGIPLGTLANLRYQKRGPKYFRRGRSVHYFFADVEAWLKSDPVLTKDSYEAEHEQ